FSVSPCPIPKCLHWVKSRHWDVSARCPPYPQNGHSAARGACSLRDNSEYLLAIRSPRWRGKEASAGCAYAGFIDEALGKIIDRPGCPSAGRMNVQCRSCYRSIRLGSAWQLVTNRPHMVCQHLFDVVNPFVVHDPTNKIDLASAEIMPKHASEHRRCSPVHVLPVEHPLCVQEFAIEHIKRKFGRQDGMLNIEQPIIACLQSSLLSKPGLGARIRRIDADVHDLWHLHAPIANDSEPLVIPIRICNKVDGHVKAQRTSKFERLEIATKRNALAEFF